MLLLAFLGEASLQKVSINAHSRLPKVIEMSDGWMFSTKPKTCTTIFKAQGEGPERI